MHERETGMILGVVEWSRRTIGPYGSVHYSDPCLECYSDCDTLINIVINYAYHHSLQKKLFGNWSLKYWKICDRANRIFEASEEDWRTQHVKLIGEYDSEDVNEVYKVEVLQREQEDSETHVPCNTCAFYISGSKESDAAVVNFYNGAIVPGVAHSKDGKEKRIDEGELATIRALIKTLDPLLDITGDTMFYYLRNVGTPLWHHEKKRY